MLLADIANGNTNWADIFFLVATILFALAAFLHVGSSRAPDRPYGTYGWFLVALGLMFVSLGWLVL